MNSTKSQNHCLLSFRHLLVGGGVIRVNLSNLQQEISTRDERMHYAMHLTIIELAYVCMFWLAPRAPSFQGLIYDPKNET